VEASSPITVEDPAAIEGKRVLVVEDGPTTTHGGMSFGAGMIAARRFHAAEIIDPRPFAQGQLAGTLERFKHIQNFLPAMGYGHDQVEELRGAIERAQPDLVVVGTPIDLARVARLSVPAVRVRYDLEVHGEAGLDALVDRALAEHT
jgi:predicted GTPase